MEEGGSAFFASDNIIEPLSVDKEVNMDVDEVVNMEGHEDLNMEVDDELNMDVEKEIVSKEWNYWFKS